MKRINKTAWRLLQTRHFLVDVDLLNWTVGVDFCLTFGIYLGPLTIDVRR